MLQIIYFSNITNNTAKFVEKLEWDNVLRIPIQGQLETIPDSPYVLICPSYGSLRSGHIPRQVKRFLAQPEAVEQLKGVIGTGNINFGEEYTLAADRISQKFNIPILYRLELAGTSIDVEKVKTGLNQFAENLNLVTKI